ncbi:MAG: CDP-alcohol phosphatidyltransferase family protein [bacterium]
MQKLKSHKRINDILLGPIEPPVLKWIVVCMPQWVTPNMLTGVGLIAAIIICVSYWLSNFNKNFLWLANFGFILNWFGDSLDGTLARYIKIERPKFGYFIDHTLDCFIYNKCLCLLGAYL